MSILLHLGDLLPVGALRWKAFNCPWTYQVNYDFIYLFNSPNFVHISSRICHMSIQTCNSSCSSLDRGSFPSHSYQHVVRHYTSVSYYRRLDAQGFAIATYNPVAAQRYVLNRQGFSSSVCNAVAGVTHVSTTKIYMQCCKEWEGWSGQMGMPNNTMPTPELAYLFLVNLFRFGLTWHTIYIYIYIIYIYIYIYNIYIYILFYYFIHSGTYLSSKGVHIIQLSLN